MTPSITARVLGRMYMRQVEYLATLKKIVRTVGLKKIPKHLRPLIKEQAWEIVRNKETLALE